MTMKRYATTLATNRFSAAFGVIFIFALIAFAQSGDAPKSISSAARAELKHHTVTVRDLPPPEVQRGPFNPSRVIPKPADAELTLPPGFEVSAWAEGDLRQPRWMALAPNGDIFVSEPGERSRQQQQTGSGRILILRDTNNDGKADERFTFAEGLLQPFGMAFWKDYLYVGNTDAVVRYTYKSGQTKAEGAPEKLIDLPAGGHWTRNILFSRDGKKLYVAVGSASNVDAETDPKRAAILEYNPDGTGYRVYASGTRNPVGLQFNPATGQLWAAVQERDLIGNDLVPEYVTSIKEGAFYGWPYSYIGQNEEPRRKGERPDLVKKAIAPDVLIQAHSAVLGLVFYDGRMFPAEYRGDAFVALHGSWNRAPRTGYKIVRVRMKNGKPVGGYDDFLVGWMLGEDRPEVWGRPVGLLVLKDGSMLITDDGANKIWRVAYSGKKR